MMTRALFLVLLLAAPALAWDGHDRLTRIALQDVTWLHQLPPVLVTPRSDTVGEIRQDYVFPFKGEKPGDRVAAATILERYAAEPDEGPDQELRVSWQQRFMGGYTGMSSRGYFHMYYPAWTVHFPLPATEMGAAPKRADLWAEAAKQAFQRGDSYWGLRYLACAMHYIEDLGQPYHATQTSKAFIVPSSPIAGTTKVTSNYHLAYEEWLARRVAQGQLGLEECLRGTEALSFDSPASAAKQVASRSHKQSGELFKACIDFFGPRFRQPVDVPLNDVEKDKLEPAEPRDRIIKASKPALELTGKAIRGLVELAKPTIRFGLLGGK